MEQSKAPKRPIRIEGDIAYIPLTRGYTAMVDAEDAHLVSTRNWCANVHRGRVYAVAVIDGKFTHLRQLIAKPVSGRYVKAGSDSLDCRKSALGIERVRARRERRPDVPERPRGRPPKKAKLVPRNPDFELGALADAVAERL
jgi:hypothetical protein